MTPTPEPWDGRAAFAANREAMLVVVERRLDPFQPRLHPLLLNIGDAWARQDLAGVRYWSGELAAAAALPVGTYDHNPPPRLGAGEPEVFARARPGVRMAGRANDVVPAGVVRDIIRRREAGEPLTVRERVLDDIDVRRNREGEDFTSSGADLSPELVAELESFGCRLVEEGGYRLIVWTLPPQVRVEPPPPPDQLPLGPWEVPDPGPGDP